MVKKIILMVLILSGILIASAKAETKHIGKYMYDDTDKRNETTISDVLGFVADIDADGLYNYELKELSRYDIIDTTVKLIIDEYGTTAIFEDDSEFWVYFETRNERFFRIIANKKGE